MYNPNSRFPDSIMHVASTINKKNPELFLLKFSEMFPYFMDLFQMTGCHGGLGRGKLPDDFFQLGVGD